MAARADDDTREFPFRLRQEDEILLRELDRPEHAGGVATGFRGEKDRERGERRRAPRMSAENRDAVSLHQTRFVP